MDDKLLRDVVLLADLMEQDGWRSLRVAGSNVSLLLGDGADCSPMAAAQAVSGAPPPPPAPVQVATPAAALSASSGPLDAAWLAVNAPNLGTFYRSPKPGAPSFVKVGDTVAAGAELCLIEVMKLFTSVRASSGGIVRHIAVDDGQLVEGGQPLIYLETQ